MGLESVELKMAVRDRDVWRWLEPAEIDSSGRHERGRGGGNENKNVFEYK